MITLGLIINPLSGIGGAVGLKGSDGAAVVQQALARGAQKKSQERSRQALDVIADLSARFCVLTCPGEMGEDLVKDLGFTYRLVDADIAPTETSADDTRRAAEAMLTAQVDLLVFAGGDGTARDICAVIGDALPVLGIPAGVKIHSAVYGITPTATGQVIRSLLCGELVDIKEAEVRDLDEEAFRNNQVRARHYGDMRVPQQGHFVQSVKQGGVEDESLVLMDIAACITEDMEDGVLYLIGSGKTTQAIMDELGLENTLLGVDAVCNRERVASDLSAEQLQELISHYAKTVAIISVMGGQGHIFGRGNQQFTPALLQQLGKQNIRVISSKTKIAALQGRPLIIDSGDPELDKQWSGTIGIVTGYRDQIVHALA